MKSCPRCGSTYPDAERFCDSDGTALVTVAGSENPDAAAAPGGNEAAGAGESILCPECHGKAEPGETICNFCGTQLRPEEAASGGSEAVQGRPAPVSPENFVPSRGQGTIDEAGGEEIYGEEAVEEPSLRERIARILGYSIAAILAVVAGGWLALHLSRGSSSAPSAIASPASATSLPTVALARNMPITVKEAGPNRDQAGARKIFDANRDALVDLYKRALETDSALRDGMVVRLHVMPDGSVSGGSVVTSTASNPSLDAEVVGNATGWKFDGVGSAPVDVDYPLIFAMNEGDIEGIGASLNAKFASLGPNETPEYASAPPVAPASPVAAATPAAVVAPPAIPPTGVAAAPPPGAPAVKPRRRPRRAAPPPPSIAMRVNEALTADKRMRRVQAYASGGMVTLTGKVFDDRAKMAAESTARRVDGVTAVVNNLATDTSAWARNEAAINQRLQAEGLAGVTAKVIGHSVYLDGTVKTNLDRQRAETVAVAAAPVKVRTNLIKVNPGFFGF